MEQAFRNPANGHTESVGGMSWLAVIIFGAFYLAYKGLWGHFFIWLFLVGGFSVLTGGPGFIIALPLASIGYAIGINGILTRSYLRKGWVEVSGVSAGAQTSDLRECPVCAETIKKAAVRCKHCGADVGRSSSPTAQALRFGWVARVICADDETRASVSGAIMEAGFPVVEMLKVGGVGAGAFEKKSDAEAAANHLEKTLGYATTVMFRDKISGDYS